MSDTKTFRETLIRYLRARIPFISIRSSERARVMEIIRDIAQELNISIYIHTLSQGMRDVVSNRTVSEDRSLIGALDFISQQFEQRQNLSFVLTEVSDLDGDTVDARHLYDVVMLAAETSGTVIAITTKSVWGQLQRLGMTVTLDFPNEDEMYEIIKDQLDMYRGQVPIEWEESEIREASAILAGISQIEVENVIATLLTKRAIKKEDLKEIRHVKDRMFADISGLERITLKGQEFAVGGLSGLRSWLDHERPLLTADLRERGIRPPRGVLLVGVPGCGKSLSAKAIASSWNLPLYRLDLSAIQGMYVGQSEGNLKEALATADHVAPCVLWIDEIEKGLAGSRDGHEVTKRLVGQFLFWLQEAKSRVFVVATANDVTQLPAELLRRGRFDEIFFVDLPTAEERKEIISIYVKRGLKRELPAELLGKLVDVSEGFAGADIESAIRDVVKEAYLKGDDCVTDEMFYKSFLNIVPLSKTSPEQIEAIRNWGRERAIPASGHPIGGADPNSNVRTGRTVLFG